MIKLDFSDARVAERELKSKKMWQKLRLAHDNLHSLDRSSGTGWVELPVLTSDTDLEEIEKLATSVKEKCEVMVVIGIGGSYAGIKAGLEMVGSKSNVEIVFMGTTFSAREITSVLEKIANKEASVCVISKSGGTSETLVAFSFIENYFKKKYKAGGEYKNRVFIITDYEKGHLRELANTEGYKAMVIPRTVGGRYSVLTPVGLFPFAVAGFDIKSVIEGAKSAHNNYFVLSLEDNDAYRYAQTRHILNRKGKNTEVFASFDDRLGAFYEWLKQLFAESEGKDNKGMMVSSLTYSTDLHSFGQFLQEGTPMLIETMISINKPAMDITIEKLRDSSPIKVMDGKKLSEVILATQKGVLAAHKKAKLPIIKIEVDELNEFTLGELFYFFELSCATACYLTGVNPFNQPGVESYKAETRAALTQSE